MLLSKSSYFRLVLFFKFFFDPFNSWVFVFLKFLLQISYFAFKLLLTCILNLANFLQMFFFQLLDFRFLTVKDLLKFWLNSLDCCLFDLSCSLVFPLLPIKFLPCCPGLFVLFKLDLQTFFDGFYLPLMLMLLLFHLFLLSFCVLLLPLLFID